MKKNVLVTGATGGIGEAICDKLHKNYNLIVVSRNEEKLKKFMRDEESIIKRITCDLKDSNQIVKMTEEIISLNLSVDILVNNAGITDDSLFIRMNYEKWQNVIKTNLDSNFLLSSSISKLMIKKKCISEVRKFNRLKIKKSLSANKLIGVKEINDFLKRSISLDQCKELINIKTRQYAKRQNTWARGHMKNWNKLYSNNFSILLKKSLKVVS